MALLPAVLVPAMILALPHSLWPAMIAYHLYCLAGSFLEGEDPRGRPFLEPERWFRTAALVVVVLLAMAEAIAHGFPPVSAWLPANWAAIAARARPWLAFAAYVVLINGWIEERFWRGPFLARTGIMPGAAAFGVVHGAAAWALFGIVAAIAIGLLTFVAGVCWGWMRRRYDSIWPCVVTHAAADAAILRIAWALLP